MWREWEWIGSEPQNMRQNTFMSLILLNQALNITYSGTKSFDLLHKLSNRSVEPDLTRWSIIKYYYDNPLAIEVLVDGVIVPPAPFTKPLDLAATAAEKGPLGKDFCGLNNYFY